MDGSQVERFRRARRDPSLAVLEGFHAVKHALRFGADLLELVTSDPEELAALAAKLAPDVADRFDGARTLPDDVFADLSPTPPSTPAMAVARRLDVRIDAALADPGPAPVVLLERPRHLGNLGAAVRVAAAAGAAAVVTTGPTDPWHPAALRGAAGLHYAVPVMRVDELPASDRPLVAMHPEGEPLTAGSLPSRAVVAFGTERGGLSEAALRRAERRVRIPMRPGVSSLNLATAVAAALYAGRPGEILGGPR